MPAGGRGHLPGGLPQAGGNVHVTTVHTNITDEDGHLRQLAEHLTRFAEGYSTGFTFDTGDGLTVEGNLDHGFRVVTFTDTEGACHHG